MSEDTKGSTGGHSGGSERPTAVELSEGRKGIIVAPVEGAPPIPQAAADGGLPAPQAQVGPAPPEPPPPPPPPGQ